MKDQIERCAKSTAPSHWRRATLGDIYDIGSSKRVLQKQWKSAGVPFYRAREIVKLAKNGSVENDLFISEEHFSEMARSHGVPQPGDLMVSAVGTLGACYAVKHGDRFYFKDASVLWFRPKAPVEPRFMQYAFLSDDLLERVKSGEGATVGTFTISRAKETELIVPPLEEQKRIVAVLDQAFVALDRARVHAEANLTDATELFGSALAAAFFSGGDVKTRPLGAICKFEGGSQPPKSQFVDSPRPGYIRLLQIRDFKSDEKAVYIPDDGRRRRCSEDDIMIGRYGASVGQIHRGKAGTYNVALIKTIPSIDLLERDYFYYYLMSDLFQKPLLSRSSRGAQDGFNKGDISDFPVPLPSKSEQQRIVERLVAVDAHVKDLEERYYQKLEEIADVRQSLLQEAFAGRLT